MVHAVIYCMRGWIAFVAFIEFGNSVRCFIDDKRFLAGHLFIEDDNEPGKNILICNFHNKNQFLKYPKH